MAPFTRRDFLKISTLAGGGMAASAFGLPVSMQEKGAASDPNDSYWALEQPSANPPLKEDLSVDVAVIGGGYTGLSAAWHLAKTTPGINVVLVEAIQVGHGASGRNGGMVLPQIGVESFEIASDKKTHKQMYDLTVDGMKALQEMVKATGIECDLELNGFLNTIVDEEDISYYEKYVKDAQSAGLPVEFWDADKTAEALGTDYYWGGAYDPNGGSVHAMKLIKALKAAAEKAGVTIYENSPVQEIVEGKTILLRMKSGRKIQAKSIVLATNAYTFQLGYFKYQVLPVHALAAVTPVLSPKQLEAIAWEKRLPYFDSREMLYHLVLTPDNRIVIGGGTVDYCFPDEIKYCGDLKKGSQKLLKELSAIYPALKGIQLEYIWDGLLDMTSDTVPSVGVTGKNKNIYYGLGYSGEGVNLAFVFGDVIAALYNGQKHAWLDTLYARHSIPIIPPGPLRWLGVQGMLKYYEGQDNP